MTDSNTTQWVIPALTLGYSVKQDPDGKFRFWNDEVTLTHRDGHWLACDGIDPDRQYDSLRAALENES